MKIAIQGELGSFHHEAAMQLIPAAEVAPEKNFSAVFQAVHNDEVEYGLCAIENNIYGPINDVYRLLERYDTWIVRDIRLHIAQQLIGQSTVSLQELSTSKNTRVLSQAPAFAQVDLWLNQYLPQATREEIGDTALSVETIMSRKDPHAVAIAGSFAAKTYGGTILAADIQDDPNNYTRFILFQKMRSDVPAATQGSLILKTDHTPGALLRALQVFAEHTCNLTKLDSHPIPGDKQHYAFYVDFELSERKISQAIIHKLEQQGCTVKLLGEYTTAS
jgi:prephenate dehydratase